MEQEDIVTDIHRNEYWLISNGKTTIGDEFLQGIINIILQTDVIFIVTLLFHTHCHLIKYIYKYNDSDTRTELSNIYPKVSPLLKLPDKLFPSNIPATNFSQYP